MFLFFALCYLFVVTTSYKYNTQYSSNFQFLSIIVFTNIHVSELCESSSYAMKCGNFTIELDKVGVHKEMRDEMYA